VMVEVLLICRFDVSMKDTNLGKFRSTVWLLYVISARS